MPHTWQEQYLVQGVVSLSRVTLHYALKLRASNWNILACFRWVRFRLVSNSQEAAEKPQQKNMWLGHRESRHSKLWGSCCRAISMRSRNCPSESSGIARQKLLAFWANRAAATPQQWLNKEVSLHHGTLQRAHYHCVLTLALQHAPV